MLTFTVFPTSSPGLFPQKKTRLPFFSIFPSYSRKRRLISSSGKVNVSSTPSTWSWRSHLCVKENLWIVFSVCLLIYSFYNLLEKSLFRYSLRWCSGVVLLQISHLYGLLLTSRFRSDSTPPSIKCRRWQQNFQ